MEHMTDTPPLRDGGVMSLKLSGKSDTLIMKFGRWYSLNILQYIHEQIAHLSKGVSTDMSNHIPFHNIGEIER